MTKYLVFFLLCFMAVHRAMMKNSSLSDNRFPKMIVFGFDKTLWPGTMGYDIHPPLQKVDISVPDSDIIDYRGQIVQTYPEVKKVLNYLFENKFIMGIASNTRESNGARQLCSMLGWNKYFYSKMIYPVASKESQIIRLSQRCRVKLSDMLFFDDKHRNIVDLERIGVVSNIVEHGMTMKDLMRGFYKYSGRHSGSLGPILHRTL